MLKPCSIIKNRKIRFALVGLGRISANHIAAIDAHSDNCELVAICDIDQNKIKPITCDRSVKSFTSLEAMLNFGQGQFDVVILTTPSGIHSMQAIACAEAGFHVITEKPMATRFNDGLDMIKACDKAGVRLFVVKQNRSNATIRLLKQAIEAKRFGRIYSVACNVFWQRPQEYYDTAAWRGTWEFDGGAFMNQASHYVDLLDWLIGPVESVQAYTATLARNIDVEDSGVVALRWRNGALGTMNVSMLTYPKNLEGSLTIIGETGTVRIGGVAVNEILVWDFADKQDTDASINEANYATTSVYGFGHQLYYADVVKALYGEQSDYIDGREGVKSLELLIAIYLSARDGKRVSLPLRY